MKLNVLAAALQHGRQRGSVEYRAGLLEWRPSSGGVPLREVTNADQRQKGGNGKGGAAARKLAVVARPRTGAEAQSGVPVRVAASVDSASGATGTLSILAAEDAGPSARARGSAAGCAHAPGVQRASSGCWPSPRKWTGPSAGEGAPLMRRHQRSRRRAGTRALSASSGGCERVSRLRRGPPHTGARSLQPAGEGATRPRLRAKAQRPARSIRPRAGSRSTWPPIQCRPPVGRTPAAPPPTPPPPRRARSAAGRS